MFYFDDTYQDRSYWLNESFFTQAVEELGAFLLPAEDGSSDNLYLPFDYESGSFFTSSDVAAIDGSINVTDAPDAATISASVSNSVNASTTDTGDTSIGSGAVGIFAACSVIETQDAATVQASASLSATVTATDNSDSTTSSVGVVASATATGQDSTDTATSTATPAVISQIVATDSQDIIIAVGGSNAASIAATDSADSAAMSSVLSGSAGINARDGLDTAVMLATVGNWIAISASENQDFVTATLQSQDNLLPLIVAGRMRDRKRWQEEAEKKRREDEEEQKERDRLLSEKIAVSVPNKREQRYITIEQLIGKKAAQEISLIDLQIEIQTIKRKKRQHEEDEFVLMY